MSSSLIASSKHSQAKSSFSIMFVGTLGGSWDEAGIIVLGGEALDRVDSTGVDESISTIWTGVWDEGSCSLTPWDDLCLTLFSHRLSRWLGRLPKSIFFDRDFLFSPANKRVWGWVSGRPSSPIISLPLFTFIVAIPK